MIILYWALEAQRVWLAAGLLLLGSFLAGSALWALAVTVVRGPGYAVTKSNPSLYLNSGDAESQKDLDNIEAAEEAEIPLLPHKAPVRPSHGSIMRSRSPSHHSSSSDSNNSSIQGIKSQGSTRSSNGSLSPEDLESDDGSSDWEDTDDDNTPLSAFMHTASKEVGHLVDTATPFVERVAAGGRLGEVGLSIQEASRGASLLAKANGQPRYCRKCSAPKPDRAHHCSSCDACVLQLDHHCAFLGSCVGHRNRRSFLQFLMYMSCFATYSFLLSMGSLFSSMTSQNNSIDGFATHVNWILVSFAGFVFSLILFPFTIFHIYLVVKNKTTIENMESTKIRMDGDANIARGLSWEERRSLKRAAQRNHPFDLGWRTNLREVFGGNGWMGVLWPIGPQPGDGRHFKVNRRKLDKLRDISRRISRT